MSILKIHAETYNQDQLMEKAASLHSIQELTQGYRWMGDSV